MFDNELFTYQPINFPTSPVKRAAKVHQFSGGSKRKEQLMET